MKATQPVAKLGEKMAWVRRYSTQAVRLIGLSEILGAAGLILPVALGILPILTPITACALIIVMVLAAREHFIDKEKGLILVNVVFILLCAFVAYGRFCCGGSCVAA